MEKKVALVTGAGSGIGKGCAIKFLENGYRVVMVGRRVENIYNNLEI